MHLFTSYYKSPIGILKLQATNTHVVSINFIEECGIENACNEVIIKCKEQFDQYFAGERKSFELPLYQKGTVFQMNVWTQLLKIPFGKTISYLNFSKQSGDVKAIRAIASANGRNNLAIVIPCHRVIGSNAKLVGYAGGLWRKKWLLDHEARVLYGIEQSVLF